MLCTMWKSSGYHYEPVGHTGSEGTIISSNNRPRLSDEQSPTTQCQTRVLNTGAPVFSLSLPEEKELLRNLVWLKLEDQLRMLCHHSAHVKMWHQCTHVQHLLCHSLRHIYRFANELWRQPQCVVYKLACVSFTSWVTMLTFMRSILPDRSGIIPTISCSLPSTHGTS